MNPVYLMPVNCTLKMVNFLWCIIKHQKKVNAAAWIVLIFIPTIIRYNLKKKLMEKKGLQIQNAKAHESHNSVLLIMNSWLIHINDEVCIYGPNHMDCHLSMANYVHGLIMKATHQDLGSQHLSPGDSYEDCKWFRRDAEDSGCENLVSSSFHSTGSRFTQ